MGGRGVGVGVLIAICATVAAAPAQASAETFSNTTKIQTIAYFSDNGVLFPYPSPIGVSGMQGTVTKAKATLTGIAYGDIDELEVMLLAPDGHKTLLLNSPCSDTSTVGSPVTWTFDDSASAQLPANPPCPSGTYRPTDSDPGFYSFKHPVPAGPYPTSLSALNGAQPNGAWQLFAVDDTVAGGGSIDGGWSLDLTTTGAPAATTKKKCKKHKRHSASEAKKKRCKKKKR